MSDKKNISATVDPDVKEYVSQSTINTSGLVNKLLKQHMNGGASEEQILEFRIQQVNSEIESLENRIAQKRDELTELQSRRKDLEEQPMEVVREAADILTAEDLEYHQQKVRYWANQAGMEIDEFVDALDDVQ